MPMFQFRKIHIENFRTIESEEILFGENKTVFVGKNDAGKSNILKAIRMLFHQENKKIKKSYFRDPAKEICVRGEVMYNEKIYEFTCRASLHREKVEFSYDPMDDETMSVFQNINLIYIPSNRKLDTKDPDNGYNKLINLILENKENREFYDPVSVQQEGFDDIANKDDTEKTMFIISLLKLYLYSIRGANQKRCNIFLIDQPENFLHPHGTKLIDRLLQQISELSHAQILYSTHSSELVSNFKKGKYELQDIVFVRRIDGVTKIKRIENKYGRYNKIMISLIFKNGSVFFSDAVILVEGETEKISIPNIYENWDWRTEIKQGEDGENTVERQNAFDLDLNNISVIDVGGKGALGDWYGFASEIFGRNNVFAMIDRDPNYDIDQLMIEKSIRDVYGVEVHHEKHYRQYHWIVLDGEFEHYYKLDAIREYLAKIVIYRAKQFGDAFDPAKLEESLHSLDKKVQKLSHGKKISVDYEKLFNRYFSHYGKPTIAFNLSIWLSQHRGYKPGMIDILRGIVEELQK